MPTPSPYIAPLTGGLTVSRSDLRDALAANAPMAFASASDVQDFTAGALKALLFNGRVFHVDPADTTTAHDGVNTLVTYDGKRFKASAALQASAVEAVLSAPPTGLTNADLGKAWQIGTAPSGAWAAHAQKIAYWTALGWYFVQPGVGWIIYVKATSGFRHYSAAAVWAAGLGALTASPGTVDPGALLWPIGVSVQGTQNAPPGTVANAYIVGSAPTGAWAGQAGKVAVAVGAAWQFLSPYEGATVWDISAADTRTYRSGLWSTPTVSGLVAKKVIETMSALSPPTNAAPATPPTTATGVQVALFTHAAKAAGNTIRFFIKEDSAATFTKSLHVDGGVSSVSFSTRSSKLSHAPGDTNSHTYAIRLHSDGTSIPTLQPSLIELEEISS